MRKHVLALILALTAIAAGFNYAAAMEGFDLGDMPPLPPPVLDDTPATSPAPPPLGGGAVLGQSPAAPVSSPLSPPGGVVAPPPPAASAPSFSTPMPPPPPLSPSSQPAGGVSAALTPPPSLGAPPSLPTVAPVVSANETPSPGKITGGRVNVRAGPNTQYESIAVLTTGSPVTVLAKHGDWYKIIFPADQLASIHKNYVTAEISGEIPEAGLPGTVSQDDADVHAFYWDKSTVVGKLSKGDPVIIKQERGQWYRIAAPATARAYVFAEYVRVDGGQQVAADATPAPVNPNLEMTTSADGTGVKARLSKDDEKIIALKEAHFKRMREQYYRNQEEEEAAAKEAADRLAKQATQLESALEDLDARLQAIDQETTQRVSHIYDSVYNMTTVTSVGSAAWAPPDPAYGGYTGWVENIGRVGGAPATYRLTKGGEIRFFLRSNMFNLEEFVGRRVWLNGVIEPAAGGSASILSVEQIRILTELELAEGAPPGGYAPPAAQPYVQPEPYASSAPVYGEPYAPYGTAVMAGDGGVLPEIVASPSGMPAQPPTIPPAPAPSDASQLPDVVGMGGQVYIADPSSGTIGEVDTDYYESPVISEIAP